MASLLARSLISRLKEIIVNISEDQINLNLFQGSAVLKDLEFEVGFCNSWLRPYLPMFSFVEVKCKFIKIRVPWTRLNSESIQVTLGPIEASVVELEEITKIPRPASSTTDEMKKEKTSTGYNFSTRITDSMQIDIQSITLNVKFLGLDSKTENSKSEKIERTPSPTIRFHLESCSFFQTDEDGTPKLAVKKVLRKRKVEAVGNKPSTEVIDEEILIFKLFRCEAATISVGNSKSEVHYDLFRYVPLQAKSILKRKPGGIISSNLVQICFESVQAVMNPSEFNIVYHATLSIIKALWRPVDWVNIYEDEKKDSDDTKGSVRPNSLSTSSKNSKNEDSFRDTAELFFPFSAEDDFEDSVIETKKKKWQSFLDRDNWMCVRISFDHMTFSLRDIGDTITLAAAGFDYAMLVLFPSPTEGKGDESTSPPCSDYVTTISTERIALVGAESLLLSDRASINKQVWNPPQDDLITLFQKPLPLWDESTVFHMKMTRKWPSVSPPQLNYSSKIVMKEFDLNFDLDQWAPILQSLITVQNYQIFVKFLDIFNQFSLETPDSMNASSSWWTSEYDFAGCRLIFPNPRKEEANDLKREFEVKIEKVRYGYYPNTNPWSKLVVFPIESAEFFTQAEVADIQLVVRSLSDDGPSIDDSENHGTILFFLKRLRLSATLIELHYDLDGLALRGDIGDWLTFRDLLLSVREEYGNTIGNAKKELEIKTADTSLIDTVIHEAAKFATPQSESNLNSPRRSNEKMTDITMHLPSNDPLNVLEIKENENPNEAVNSPASNRGSFLHSQIRLISEDKSEHLSEFSEITEGLIEPSSFNGSFRLQGSVSNIDIHIGKRDDTFFIFRTSTFKLAVHFAQILKNLSFFGKSIVLNSSLFPREFSFENLSFGGYHHFSDSERFSFQMDANKGDLNQIRNLIQNNIGIRVPDSWLDQVIPKSITADDCNLLRHENDSILQELARCKKDLSIERERLADYEKEMTDKLVLIQEELTEEIDRLKSELARYKSKNLRTQSLSSNSGSREVPQISFSPSFTEEEKSPSLLNAQKAAHAISAIGSSIKNKARKSVSGVNPITLTSNKKIGASIRETMSRLKTEKD